MIIPRYRAWFLTCTCGFWSDDIFDECITRGTRCTKHTHHTRHAYRLPYPPPPITTHLVCVCCGEFLPIVSLNSSGTWLFSLSRVNKHNRRRAFRQGLKVSLSVCCCDKPLQ